jgi:hypothetical protein
MTDTVVVRPAGPADEDRIAALLDEVLGGQQRDLREAVWRWRRQAPGGADATVPSFLLVERGGRVQAVQGMIPLRTQVVDRTVFAACTCDFAVDRSARGVGLRLKAAAMSGDVAPLAFSTSSNTSASTVTQALGGSAVDSARVDHVLPLRLSSILRRRWPGRPATAAGALGDLLLSGWHAANGAVSRRRVRLRSVGSFGEEFDRLWEAVSSRRPVQIVRDAAYLEWRYRRSPYGAAWSTALVHNGVVHGLVVVGSTRAPALGGRHAAAVLELYDDGVVPSASRLLAAAAARHAASTGAEVLFARTADAQLARVLRRTGFRSRRQEGSPVTYWVADDDLRPLLDRDEAWHLSLGDGDAWAYPEVRGDDMMGATLT